MRSNRRNTYLIMLSAIALLAITGCKVVDWGYDTGKKAYDRLTMPSLEWAVAAIVHHDPDVRREALNVIAYRAEKTGDAQLVDIIGTVLNGDAERGGRPDQSALVRASAAIALGEIRERNIAIPHLLRAMERSGEKPVVMIEVIRALGELGNGNSDVQAALIKAMTDKDRDIDVRREAAVTIGMIGDEKAIPVLIETLVAEKGTNLRVALGACESLQKITGKPFGPEEPENWRLWYAENANEEIVKAYVKGRLELAKLWPKKGPLSQRIPESVTRVFKALGAELRDSAKSVVDTGKTIVKVPYGAARLIVGKPIKGVKKVLPKRKQEMEEEEKIEEETVEEGDDEPGFLTKTGRVAAAPFVFVGKVVIWPFKQVVGLFSSDDDEEEEAEPAEEIEPVEPEAEPEEEAEESEEEAEPGFLRKAGRVAAAPFVFVGKVVIWPFKQVVGLFSSDDDEEAEPTEEIEPVEPEAEPEEEAEETEEEAEPGFLRKAGRVVAAPFVFVGKVVIWPFKQVVGLFSSDDEEEAEPAEEEIEPVEPEAEPEEEAEETEEGEDEPGFLRKAGRVVAAPFVFVGKVVIWPFKQVVGLFSSDDEEEAEPAEEEIEPVEPEAEPEDAAPETQMMPQTSHKRLRVA